MIKSTRSFLPFLVVNITFLVACSVQPVTVINTTANGVAIKGYDPVAYFTMGRPVKGQQNLQFEWRKAKWFFSSEKHLKLFEEDPAKYAPQYGGY